MNGVDIKLSNLGEHYGIFHNLEYTNDREGGNGNLMSFQVENVSGNEVFVDGCFETQNPDTKEWTRTWRNLNDFEGLAGVRIYIRGSIEHAEFLQMLQLILETEKMVDIIKP